jgi:hypothetical protein
MCSFGLWYKPSSEKNVRQVYGFVSLHFYDFVVHQNYPETKQMCMFCVRTHMQYCM